MAPAVVVTIDVLPDTSAPGRSTAFLVLTAFLLTFAFIRTSARLDPQPEGHVVAGERGDGRPAHPPPRVGDLPRPGVRVPGLRRGPAEPVVAHLGHRLRDRRGPDDRRVRAVALPARRLLGPEGRLSVDAAVLATVFAVLVVLGTKPFGLDDAGSVLATVLLFLEAVALVRARVPQGPLPHRRRRALRPLLGARGRRPPGQARVAVGPVALPRAARGQARRGPSGASGPTAARPSSATASSPSRPASRSPSRAAAGRPTTAAEAGPGRQRDAAARSASRSSRRSARSWARSLSPSARTNSHASAMPMTIDCSRAMIAPAAAWSSVGRQAPDRPAVLGRRRRARRARRSGRCPSRPTRTFVESM